MVNHLENKDYIRYAKKMVLDPWKLHSYQPYHGNILGKVRKLTKEFKKIEVKQLPREHNCHINALANIASSIKSS